MTTAHEEDVVIAFRQAVEEELRKVQSGASVPAPEDILSEGIPTDSMSCSEGRTSGDNC